VMGNGKKVMKRINTMSIITNNCEGEIEGNVDLSDAIFLRNGCYNLISVTKFMQIG
jgi:hypothetical protein